MTRRSPRLRAPHVALSDPGFPAGHNGRDGTPFQRPSVERIIERPAGGFFPAENPFLIGIDHRDIAVGPQAEGAFLQTKNARRTGGEPADQVG